jgi:hypothetical protein
MKILGIDPGTTLSAWVLWDSGSNKVLESSTVENDQVLARVKAGGYSLLGVEMIESQGMAVGRTTFETIVWIGRFLESAQASYQLVHRGLIKLHRCGSARAKDGNIRQALVDLYGGPGVKKAPGPTYGLVAHQWQALAVAAHLAEGGPVRLGRNQVNVPEAITKAKPQGKPKAKPKNSPCNKPKAVAVA